MRRIVVISAVPFIAVVALCVWSCVACATITFGIPPHQYRFETLRGTLTFERVFSCVQFDWPAVSLESPHTFEREFYEGWHRADMREDHFGVFTCNISYVISQETEALDPRSVVTPSSFIAIPHWFLLGVAACPLALAIIAHRWTRRAHKPINPMSRTAGSHENIYQSDAANRDPRWRAVRGG